MTQPSPVGRSAEVLLVDDDENDILMLRTAFAAARCDLSLHAVGNGRDCLAFLRKEEPFQTAPTPDLVVLDLNMPVLDGRQTLEAITTDPQLTGLPVVVMTTSRHEEDIRQMYALRCSTFIVKPFDFDELERAADVICQYWFTLAALPDHGT